MMRSIAGTLLAALVLSATAEAAVIHVTPKIGPVLNDDIPFIDPAMIVSQDDAGIVLRPKPGYYILQIDFLLNITDLQPGQVGFGNAAVNIDLFGGVRQWRELPWWIPDAKKFDTNGAQIGGVVPKWAGNQDAGQDTTDLQNILIETAPRSFGPEGVDPRRTLAVPPYHNDLSYGLGSNYDDGEYFGSILIEFDSLAGNTGGVSAYVTQGSTYDADLMLSAAGVTGGAAQSVSFSIVPEPMSVALVSIALLGFIALRPPTRPARD